MVKLDVRRFGMKFRGEARLKHSGRLRRLPVGGMIAQWQDKPLPDESKEDFARRMQRDYGEPN